MLIDDLIRKEFIMERRLPDVRGGALAAALVAVYLLKRGNRGKDRVK